MNLKKTFLLLVVLFAWNTSQAKYIEGTVVSASDKYPIGYCMISVKDNKTIIYTDYDGNFDLDLPHGTHVLKFNAMGYKIKEMNIEVTSNTSSIRVELDIKSNLLKSVELIEKISRETKQASFLEQKNAEIMVQSLGSKQMAMQGVSNAADGIAKISSITKVDGKGLFVRGLGDRYNNAMLNHLPIVSDNTDTKVINLALIPIGMVRNIKVYKTFNSNIYGDFAGATIDIETKNEYPESMFFDVGIKSSFNTITTGNNFYMLNRGTSDLFGFGSKNRTLPSSIDLKNPDKSLPIKKGESLLKHNLYSLSESISPPSSSIDLFGGNKYKLGDDKTLGFMIYANFDNSNSYTNGIRKFNYETSKRFDFKEENWNNEKSSLFVFNTGLSKQDKYDLSMNIININHSDNYIKFLKGFSDGAPGDKPVSYFRNTYSQVNILISQFLSKIYIHGDKEEFLDMGVSFSKTKRQEPDRISLSTSYNNINDNIDLNSLLMFQTNSSNSSRFWTDMVDYEIAQKLIYQFKINETNIFNIGLNFKQKLRESDINGYSLSKETKGDINNNGGITFINPEQSINQVDGYWDLFQSANYRGYKANQFTYAGYLDYKKRFNMLLINFGLRVEYSSQALFYRTAQDIYNSEFRRYDYNPVNLLPELNLKYKLNEKSNLRISMSNTITRPSMLELRPSRYINADLTEVIGNEKLKNSTNYNLDIKWEKFSNGGILAFTIFGKYIKNPIEQVLTDIGATQTYINTKNAHIVGAELDIDQNIGRLLNSEKLKTLFVGFNLAYLKTQISLGNDDISKAMTNIERPLQGASPIMLNSNISYKIKYSEDKNTTVSVVFNYFDDRLFSASTTGAGDVYEKGIPTLDLICKNKLSKKLSFDFSFRNIINPDIKKYQKDFGQGSNYKNVINTSYKMGLNIGASIKYSM